MKLLLQSITRISVEQIKTIAFRIEQMNQIAYVKNAPDMRKAQMNDALVKTLDPQLARIALKKQLHWNQTFHSISRKNTSRRYHKYTHR